MADKIDKVQETSEEEVPETKAPEKIKVGENEYSQDELDKLVSLGKIGIEAEEKYQTKIDKVWPEFTKSRQEIKDLKEKMADVEKAETKAKEEAGEPLSETELRVKAREEAKKLGLMLDDDFDKMYAQRRQAEKLIEDTDLAVGEASEKYGIKTDTESLLKHMQETGIRNPEKALKDMFEEQIDKWKEKELGKKKGSGLVTETASTAGSKKPKEIKTTKGTLSKHIREALYSRGE